MGPKLGCADFLRVEFCFAVESFMDLETSKVQILRSKEQRNTKALPIQMCNHKKKTLTVNVTVTRAKMMFSLRVYT